MLKILLAEDNRGDVILVKRALEEHDVRNELYVVKDGEEALRFIAQMGKSQETPCPDVLLLDLNLPKIGGAELLGEFRKHPECAETPVIIVSSSNAPKDRTRMNAMGVNRYFRKPSDLDAFMQLGAIIREVVERNGNKAGDYS